MIFQLQFSPYIRVLFFKLFKLNITMSDISLDSPVAAFKDDLCVWRGTTVFSRLRLFFGKTLARINALNQTRK